MTAVPPALPHGPHPPITLDDTLGASFLGHFGTTLLYGITTLQAFMYYRAKYNDHVLLKLAVRVKSFTFLRPALIPPSRLIQVFAVW